MLFRIFLIINKLGAILVIIDAIISYFYIKNPFKYSYALIESIKTPNFTMIQNYSYDVTSSNITEFKEKYTDKTLSDEEVMDYIFYNKDVGGKDSERFFICNLIFGFIQFVAALISFNLKNFHGKWKMDVITLIIV